MTPNSRAEAAVVLGRVLRHGAFSNVLLGSLGDSPDARLVRRLVYGTLRYLVRVDRLIAAASDRPLGDMQPGLLDVLRIATWELRFGEGAPHAAVNEAVEAAGAGFGKRAAGFANAVLRRVQGSEEDLPAGDAGRAMALGVEPWIYEQLVGAWGAAEAEAFLLGSLEPAARMYRVRDHVADDLPVGGIPGVARSAPDDGEAAVMDPSSVAVGLTVGPQPGMSVLDMAAAPGGKTLHLYDQMGGVGLLVAADRHHRRVVSARRRLERAGVIIPWVVADGAAAPFPAATFDRVLLDAPCTGLGTLRRRPEIRHRLNPDAPSRAATVQRRLLDAALDLVKPDGYVVYAVCTVFAEETTAIVEGRRAQPPDGLPGRAAGNGWLLGPHLTAGDGMFISIVRRGS